MRLGIIVVTALTAGAATACATRQVDPARVSWGDLLRGDRLQQHLQSRRAELHQLDQGAMVLAQLLAERTRALRTLDAELANQQAVSARSQQEVDAVRQSVAESQRQLTLARTRVHQLSMDLQRQRGTLAQTKAQQIEQDAEVARHKAELLELEREVGVLERAIDRTLLVRARVALVRHASGER